MECVDEEVLKKFFFFICALPSPSLLCAMILARGHVQSKELCYVCVCTLIHSLLYKDDNNNNKARWQARQAFFCTKAQNTSHQCLMMSSRGWKKGSQPATQKPSYGNFTLVVVYMLSQLIKMVMYGWMNGWLVGWLAVTWIQEGSFIWLFKQHAMHAWGWLEGSRMKERKTILE